MPLQSEKITDSSRATNYHFFKLERMIILREFWRANLSQRGGVNEIDVAANNLVKGVLGMLAVITRQQLQIGFAHIHQYAEAEREIRQGFFQEGES